MLRHIILISLILVSLCSNSGITLVYGHTNKIIGHVIGSVESLWDPIYDGYLSWVNDRENEVDYRKFLSDQVYVARMYLELYRLFGNNSYLGKVRRILDYINRTFFIPESFFLVPLKNRDGSSALVPNINYSPRGYMTCLSVLHLISLLAELCDISREKGLLSFASRIYDRVVRIFWGNDSGGGILIMGGDNELIRYPYLDGLFTVVSYKLYRLTGNGTYRYFIGLEMKVFDRMWDDGFWKRYYADFTIMDDYRDMIYNVLSFPLYALLIGYQLGLYASWGRIAYLARMHEYFWDDDHEGFYDSIDDENDPLDDWKYAYNHAFAGIVFCEILRYLGEELGDIKDSILDYARKDAKVIIERFYVRKLGYFCAKFTDDWDLRDDTLYPDVNSLLLTAMVLLDADGDELINYLEEELGTDMFSNDTDMDGLPDGWEYDYGTDIFNNDSDKDYDNDALSNLDEYLLGTDPRKSDTDNDLIPDNIDQLPTDTEIPFYAALLMIIMPLLMAILVKKS